MTRHPEQPIPVERRADEPRAPSPDPRDFAGAFDCMWRAAESYSATPPWGACGE